MPGTLGVVLKIPKFIGMLLDTSPPSMKNPRLDLTLDNLGIKGVPFEGLNLILVLVDGEGLSIRKSMIHPGEKGLSKEQSNARCLWYIDLGGFKGSWNGHAWINPSFHQKDQHTNELSNLMQHEALSMHRKTNPFHAVTVCLGDQLGRSHFKLFDEPFRIHLMNALSNGVIVEGMGTDKMIQDVLNT